jgi:prepilin-type N-terminal cleavage/methylation domain-containing protein
MKSHSGFTLIEMAVVLAIIAILAAMLTPLITSYIDQARQTRAVADVGSIAKAYILYYRDTGTYPVFNSGSSSSGTPSMNCQVSGTTVSTPSSNHADWTGGTALNCVTSTTRLIRNYLNVNTMGFSTGNNFGGAAYRGPYLDGLDTLDPWSNAYVVNSKALNPNDNTQWAFVISAGPNGTLETDPWQAKTSAFVTSGDDITSLIR